MKICILGEFSGNPDEAMRKTSCYLLKELSRDNSVFSFDILDIYKLKKWSELKYFDPDIIHYMHGPSIKSLILLKLLSIYCGKPKKVASAMHPKFSSLDKYIIKFFKPDLVLTQSNRTEIFFKNLGIRTEFLASGVDLRRFHPRSIAERNNLRKKYMMSEHQYIILHVGSLKAGRNIQLLERFQKEGYQIIIVGAISTGVEKNLVESLKAAGFIIIDKYIKNIEEIYALSDCYIFPVSPENTLSSIEMPLTVLEALACNISVISTPFGALPRIFKEGNGLCFINNVIDFNFDNIKFKKDDIRTREKVLDYSWENIAKRYELIMHNLMSNNDTKE